jgi:acetyl-CoA carboxylase beta subunit
MTITYVHAFTEYEIEACNRDAAKHAQGCNECSQTEYEIEACKRDVADAHTFTAATAMAAKIERRAAIDAEIPALEAEIATAKTKHADSLAAKDAEITALMVEIAAAKTKRNNKLAAMDAEIAGLEAEIAAHR